MSGIFHMKQIQTIIQLIKKNPINYALYISLDLCTLYSFVSRTIAFGCGDMDLDVLLLSHACSERENKRRLTNFNLCKLYFSFFPLSPVHCCNQCSRIELVMTVDIKLLISFWHLKLFCSIKKG